MREISLCSMANRPPSDDDLVRYRLFLHCGRHDLVITENNTCSKDRRSGHFRDGIAALTSPRVKERLLRPLLGSQIHNVVNIISTRRRIGLLAVSRSKLTKSWWY